MTFRRILFFIIKVFPITYLVFYIVSCTPFAPKERSFLKKDMPTSYSVRIPGLSEPEKWWEAFNDPELNNLINKALTGNFTLKEAWARFKQARAIHTKSKSSLFPYLDFNQDASTGRTRNKSGDRAASGVSESYALGLFAGYEPDFWGKIASESLAARLDKTAAKEDFHAAALIIAARVAELWVNIISQKMQTELLKKQLKTNLIYLELIEIRFKNAMVSALDVYQQKQVVEGVRAKLPIAATKKRTLMNELAVLTGNFPGRDIFIKRAGLPDMPELPRPGLPARLLAMRPDVKAAKLRLLAADWRISAAKADMLPSFFLRAEGAFKSDKLSLIFDNWFIRFAENLAMPLIDGQKRKGEVDRRIAIADENLWAYRRIVYNAIKDVEDALVAEQNRKEHIETIKRQMDAAKNALQRAGDRYLKGLSDYIPVLTQILAVQNLERNLIEQKTLLILDRIRLHRALGGRWPADLPEKKKG